MNENIAESSRRVIEWVIHHIFHKGTHDKHSSDRIAGIASRNLGMEVDRDMIEQAKIIVCHEKNFDLEAYPFT